jgi:hypothetical protein
LEVSDTIDEWETPAPLLTYETTIEKHGDTIIVEDQTDNQLAAQTLPTPRESPEPSQAATTLPTTGLQPTEESSSTPTEPESTDILDQSDVVVELTSREMASTSTSSPSLPNLERPANPFAHPDQESKKGATKGASTSNILQGKRTRKPAAFTFERLFWKPMNQHFAHYHSSFLASATFAIPKIHIKDLPPPPKTRPEEDYLRKGAALLLRASQD